MKRLHRANSLRRSRPVVRCLSALAESQARAIRALRSRPARPALLAAATDGGKPQEQATRSLRNHREKAFQAQLVPALARRRRKMLVSLWALPLSEGRRGPPSTVSSGSGVGSIQAASQSSTAVTPNPSIKRTCLRQAAYVKRWASQGTRL